MWTRASLAILFAAAFVQPAAADDYTVAFSVPGSFWQPATAVLPDLTLAISGNEIRVATPCFISELVFQLEDGKPAYAGEPGWVRNDSADCAYSRVTFDAFKSTLRRVSGLRRSGSELILSAADGSDVVALKPMQPSGIEFQELTITSFRNGSALSSISRAGSVPDLLFFSGHVEGTIGCGPLFGATYRHTGKNRFEFFINYLDCAHDKHSEQQADRIRHAFDGARNVEKHGRDYVLRDRSRRVQIVFSPL